MDFSEASKARLPAGQHHGDTLDEVASTDDGLLYLDFLLARIGEWNWVTDFQEPLKAYMLDKEIQQELHNAMTALDGKGIPSDT